MSERNFSRKMADAPLDESIIVLVPTGDKDDPIAQDIAFWDEDESRFYGPWRNTEGEGAYPNAEPIAWARLPDGDDYNEDMDAAPTDVEILLLIPLGEDDGDDALVEVGLWDDVQGRWHGPWRNEEGEDAVPHAEPVAWCLIPEIDADIAKEYGIELIDV